MPDPGVSELSVSELSVSELGALADLGRFLDEHAGPALLVGAGGGQVPLPGELYRLLGQIVAAMRHGEAITLVRRAQRLTAQEAAGFLGIRRPTLVRLLDDGRIPCEQPGRHRRIMVTDLLDYQERQRTQRLAAVDQMTEAASEVSPEDIRTAEDFAAALEIARRRAARRRDRS